MKRKLPESIMDARDSIQQAIDTDGQFSHNICSCVLRSVAEKHGQKAANSLIVEFGLTELYQIHQVKDTNENT